MQEKTISFSNQCFVEMEYNDEQLIINLADLQDDLQYKKMFTKQDIDINLHQIVSLEEIYSAIIISPDIEIIDSLTSRCVFLCPRLSETITEDKQRIAISKGGTIQVILGFQSKYSKKTKLFKIQLKLKQAKTFSQLERAKLQWKIQRKIMQKKIVQDKKLFQKQNEASKRKIKQLEYVLNSEINDRIILQKKVQKLQKLLDHRKSCNSQLEKAKNFSLLIKSTLKSELWDINVYPSSTVNKLKIADQQYRCSIGKNGVTPFKKQGDGKSPVGTFPLRQIWVRQDKVPPQIFKTILQTGFNVSIITVFDGWCDDPDHEQYNKHVDLRKFDNRISHQNLWRQDNLYDFILVVGYNDQPPIPGRGSAIFFHIARENYSGTAGCVAVSPSDLWQIVNYLKPFSNIRIYEEESNQ